MKDRVEVFWFSEQPYGDVTDAELARYDSGRDEREPDGCRCANVSAQL